MPIRLSQVSHTGRTLAREKKKGIEGATHLPAVECIIAFPVFLPNALSKSAP